MDKESSPSSLGRELQPGAPLGKRCLLFFLSFAGVGYGTQGLVNASKPLCYTPALAEIS